MLKRSAVHFLVGKGVSALLTLIILFWLVRLLSVEEYGAYVTFVAGMELTLSMASLGLPWVAARYLPEFRLHASGSALRHFVWRLTARIALLLVASSALLYVAMPWLLAHLELVQQTDVARLFLLVLLADGLGRHIRENTLEPLLQQGSAQISLVVRNIVLLFLLSIAALHGAVRLDHVVLAELTASILGAILAFYSLATHLHKHRGLLTQDGWQAPNWRVMQHMARHMYFSRLVNLTYSPQVFVFLIQHYLGLEATALFGFLRKLYGQISRYLPATLLFSLVRPKLVASYIGEGGMADLARNANLVGKLSLFVLMPILVFVWLADGELLTLLSGGKFAQSGYYLAGLLMALILYSQRQILETVAVASGKSHLCIWGASFGVLVLPLTYLLLKSGLGLWGPIIAIIISEMIFNVTVTLALTRITAYRPDATGFYKLGAAALAGFVLAQQIVISTPGWPRVTLMAVLACVLFMLTSYFFKPFRADERATLNHLLGRKIFIW
jgi:O-antigen/teichoic acid export membrane protein